MKPGTGVATLLLGLVVLPTALPAGETADPARPPRSPVRHQLHRLVQADAGVTNPVPPAADAAAAPMTEGTLQLEPMLIEEPKLKELQRVETRAEIFFRTGTIWEKVGPRFTRRFWVEGNRGIGFTLSW